MPRKNLIRSNIFPYHVTARVNNKENFPIPLEFVWKIVTDECLVFQLLFDAHVHALVLMPNHLHLLMTTSNEDYDLGQVMQNFMNSVTKQIHQISGRSGRVFGERYFWSIIQSGRYYGHALKYVYRNPVRAKLGNQIEDYPFSTIQGLIGSQPLPMPIHFTQCGFEGGLPNADERFNWLEWLNKPFSKENEQLIRKALRRKEVRLLINPSNRLPYEELNTLL